MCSVVRVALPIAALYLWIVQMRPCQASQAHLSMVHGSLDVWSSSNRTIGNYRDMQSHQYVSWCQYHVGYIMIHR